MAEWLFPVAFIGGLVIGVAIPVVAILVLDWWYNR